MLQHSRLRENIERERYMWKQKDRCSLFSFPLWMDLITVTLFHRLPGKNWLTFLLCSMCLPWVNTMKCIIWLTGPWRPGSLLWAMTDLRSTKIKLLLMWQVNVMIKDAGRRRWGPHTWWRMLQCCSTVRAGLICTSHRSFKMCTDLSYQINTIPASVSLQMLTSCGVPVLGWKPRVAWEPDLDHTSTYILPTKPFLVNHRLMTLA